MSRTSPTVSMNRALLLRRVAVWLPTERDDIAGFDIDDVRASSCRTAAEVCEALGRPETDAFVCELSSRLHWSPELSRLLIMASLRIPILVRVEMSTATAAAICELAVRARSLHVSLSGWDRLRTDVRTFVKDPDCETAEQAILRRSARSIPPSVRRPVVTAVLAAKRHVAPRDLARLCNCSLRKLQWQLHRVGAPGPNAMLGWALSLHTMWRVGIREQSVKRAAIEAGFACSAELSNYMLRHVGQRPTIAASNGGFWTLLESFAENFNNASLAEAQSANEMSSLRVPK
jgi:hypothetical protein